MYSLEQLKRGLRNPKQILREVNRLYHTGFRRFEVNRDGVNFFEEDWDNLLILDACRYDNFATVAREINLPGHLEARQSRGACTMEFLRANVDGADLSDTVYVSGTTMMYRESVFKNQLSVNFHDVVDVWQNHIDVGEWGIKPGTMAKKTRKVASEYPNKRLVAHFIQPHIPFVGSTGEKYAEELQNTVWKDCFDGSIEVSDNVIRRAYAENVKIVMEKVTELLDDLDGKTVVTADHGQYLGERCSPVPIKEYGHPNGIYTDPLVKVPWHVYEDGERREITAEASAASYDERQTDDLDEKARNHLQELGYLES
jgi:hypothetical protein